MGCLSYFFRRRRRSSEREPLLPTHHDSTVPTQGYSPREPLLHKLADITGALQKGKLPSQDQLNIILQSILKSDLFHDEGHVMSGYGSLSQNGRRVLQDMRETIESILQIGMEKNGGLLIMLAPIISSCRNRIVCSG
jgi:Family of unknown function (DUF5923)